MSVTVWFPTRRFLGVTNRYFQLTASYLMFILVYHLQSAVGSTPGTITNKEWRVETDKKFQAWPRTAGPPVVMNPISRQNFIVKSSIDE